MYILLASVKSTLRCSSQFVPKIEKLAVRTVIRARRTLNRCDSLNRENGNGSRKSLAFWAVPCV